MVSSVWLSGSWIVAALLLKAHFAVDGDPLRALIDWLDQSVPLDVGGPMAIGLHVWGAIGLLFALLYLLRHRWVLSSCLCGIWAVGAAFLPPNLNATQVDGSRALAVNAGDRTLVVGSIRLSQSTGGARVINAGQWPVSIEASRGGDTCIIGTDDQQKWMFSGRPGQRRRISYLMWLDAKLSGLERVEQLSKLAPAPWSEGHSQENLVCDTHSHGTSGHPGETLGSCQQLQTGFCPSTLRMNPLRFWKRRVSEDVDVIRDVSEPLQSVLAQNVGLKSDT